MCCCGDLTLHGFRELYGEDVIDYPGSWHLYKDEAERDADINDPNTETKADHVVQDLTVQVSPKGLNLLQKAMSKDDNKSST